MQQQFTQYLQRNCLWLALFLHLLLLGMFSTTFLSFHKAEEPPEDYIPAYAYSSPILDTSQKILDNKKQNETDKTGIEKKVQQQQSFSNDTSQETPETNVKTDEEPIHLIGDKNKTPKPLIKLIGRALTAHMKYPKIAADFHLQGTAIIGFSLSPSGEVSNIHIVKSSGTKILDDAAISGLSAISPLKGTDQFLTTTEYMVIGFMFR